MFEPAAIQTCSVKINQEMSLGQRETGIPVIYKALEDNGSPKPLFDTDDSNRSFFVVEFPIYPDFKDKVNIAVRLVVICFPSSQRKTN